MCRIAGIIDFHQPANLRRLPQMRDCMWRGGPDDQGEYTDPEFPISLGVRRLALLDLSEHGHQPMANAMQDLWIAFNGELYNFRAIKQELQALGHVFFSGTDTEVVLLAYQQWGTNCFNKFNGMFGLCIWDKKREQLILARDHAGMKPLYYYLDSTKKQLYFASEVRAFKAFDPTWPEDESWRVNLLGYGHMPEPGTTLQQVLSLPKGNYMQVDVRSFSNATRQWYTPPLVYNALDKAAAGLALRQTLDLAVQEHLVADAPVGLFLSGGIDSSILTLLAAKHIPENLCTLSITFDEAPFSEKKFQEIIVQKTGCRHQSFNVDRDEFERSMPDIMQAMDQPSNDGINSYLISKYAKACGLKAVLSGIGADELLGGYDTCKRRQTALKLQKLPRWLLGMAAHVPDERLKRISFLKHRGRKAEYLFYRGFYTTGQIAFLLGMKQEEVTAILLRNNTTVPTGHYSSKKFISRLEQDFYLQNQLLRDTDYMSMWHGVEIRMPFLDKHVMDLCAATAPEIRFEEGMPKKWLVDSFKDLLPQEIWNRKKMGFVFPFDLWFRGITIAGSCDWRFNAIERRFRHGKIKWSRYWAFLQCLQQPILFSQPVKKVLFVTLKAFSATGGIEKFNRAFSLALQQNARENGWQISVLSLWDRQPDEQYISRYGFTGFNRNRSFFARVFLKEVPHYDIVIAGHINLAPLMVLAKLKSRAAQFILIGHGIEVWQPLRQAQKRILKICHSVWSVSRFTAGVLNKMQRVPINSIKIFPNTLDPFFGSAAPEPAPDLRARYILSEKNKVILTLTRLASTEKYKGYDEVLQALPAVLESCPAARYLICGKADEQENTRLQALIAALGIEQQVILTGFIPDNELTAHYELADIFVMPSRKEGFGIVFIEAAWLGLQVIAGNQDGSVDAMLDGKLGTLVTPGDSRELEAAIVKAFNNPFSPGEKARRKQLVESNFGFDQFKKRQLLLLEEMGG